MTREQTETETSFRDYYEVLHLQQNADAVMVDQAYWHLARLYNAAIPTDSSARQKLDELNEAYGVLRSPELRRRYDMARNALLGEGAVPIPPQAAPAPPPLAVMAKQQPKPRQGATSAPSPPAPFRLRPITIPPLQGTVASSIMVVLAAMALASGAEPGFVMGLLVVGVACCTIPLVRRLPRLPTPSFTLPAIRAPRLPDRPVRPALDPDTLRDSTEAMRARLREESDRVAAQTPHSSTAPEAVAREEPKTT